MGQMTRALASEGVSGRLPRARSARGRAHALARSLPTSAIIAIGAVVALAAFNAGAAGATSSRAVAARTLSLNESGSLHLTSKHGFTLNEQGSASGTIRGTIYIHLNLVSSTRVTAEVNIYPSAGSLSGSGSASYRVVGSYASFSGTLSIDRGSGVYAHAHAAALGFTGTIQRRHDAVSVRVNGSLSY